MMYVACALLCYLLAFTGENGALSTGRMPSLQPSRRGVLSVSAGGWQYGRGRVLQADVNNKPTLGPNLTSCHTSFTDGGTQINCCPVKPAAAVVNFVPPDYSSETLRVRRAAHRITDTDYLSKYQAAVALMKQLPTDHPHSLRRQAEVHCAYCTNAFDQVNNSDVGFQVHASWLFFPWHRAYLYFHERILGKLIGDDSFALPFWNWDHPAGMMIPQLYLNGSLNSTGRDPAHLRPQVLDAGYSPDSSSGEEASPDELIAKNLALMYNQMVSGAKTPELFMGCKLRPGQEGFCDGPGTLEDAPHGTVHTWTGSPKNPNREDMGALYSAARDPIFYAHHANVDRLWAVWKELIRKNALEFADTDWLDAYFYFYDENARLVRVTVRDVLDPSKLGYRYEQVDLPWLNAKPKPTLAPTTARGILVKLIKRKTVPRLETTHLGVGALDTITTVVVPREVKDVAGEEVLVVYGIDTRKDVYVKFDVYVNVANMTAAIRAGPRCREYAGTFVRLPSGSARMSKKAVLKLGISELIQGLEAEKERSLLVTLVPLGGKGNTTVEGIRVEHMQV